MKFLTAILTVLLFSLGANATTYTSVGNGSWSDPTTWTPNGVPQYTDSVVIAVGDTVSILDGNANGGKISGRDLGAPYWLHWEIERFYHSGGMYIADSGMLIVDYLVNPECNVEMDEETGFINGGNMLIDGTFKMVRHDVCTSTDSIFHPISGVFQRIETADHATNHNNDWINLGSSTLSATGHLIVGDDMILVEGSSMIHDGNTGSTGDDLYLVGNPYVCGVGFLQIEDKIYTYDTIYGMAINVLDPLYRTERTFDWLIESNMICESLTLGDPDPALPIELLSFVGRVEGDLIKLTWVTASELNNDYFVIERSIDGKYFNELTTIGGGGTTTTPQTYSTVDFNMNAPLIYYRLTQVDYDGASETFKAIVVKVDYLTMFKVYPNPVKDVLNVNSMGGNLRIFNSLGQIVLDREVTNESIAINYASGVYTAFFERDGIIEKTKLVIK